MGTARRKRTKYGALDMKGTKTLLSYILFIIGYQYKPICSLPEPPCEQDHFQCQNRECVPNFWKCDGQDDCGDDSDESSCPVTSHADQGDCDEGELKCNNNRCIDVDWKCDDEDDCGDGSDERNCTINTSSRPRTCDAATDFRCGNGKCVPRSLTCNNIDDCGDNSDESTTTAPNCVPFVGCKDAYFQCNKSGVCIHKVLVCDRQFNCGKDKNGEDDKSDETGCASRSCESTEFKCDNGRCVSKQWHCDKQDDCGDFSDERNCSMKACPAGDFKCVHSGHCIRGIYKCDGFNDCLLGSDEKGCSASSTLSPVKPTSSKPYKVVTRKNPSTTLPPTKTYTTASSCRSDQYKCKNEMKCLHQTWVCDGEADCQDLSDESADICSSHKCQANHFRCANKKCISSRNKCDGHDHCGDNSDEDVKVCRNVQVPCTSETHRCSGSTKCIPQTSVCDKRQDCPWNDDESTNCGVNECLKNNGNCSHVCRDLKIGFKCECPRGHEHDSTGTKCLDINECHVFGKCSQACVNYKGSFACQCDKGYTMDPLDNRTCRAGGPMSYLVFTNRYDLREISANGRDAKLVALARSASSLAVSYAERMLYWSDNGLKTISRALINGTGKSEVIVSGVEKPEGLALDWLGRKIYWIDGSLNRIYVSNLDGTHKKVVVKGVDGHDIRAIEVYPEKGYIFWTTWGTPSEIRRSHLDGTNQSVIIGANILLHWPKGITLDKTKDRLYWAEMSTICSISINGRGYKRILFGLSSPYALAVFEDHMYWTDFVEKAIFKANKFNGRDKQKFDGNYTAPLDIAIFHPLAQATVEHPCRHDNGGCSHLCFMTPTHSRVCACPGVMALRGDQKTCIGPVQPATTTVATTEKVVTTPQPPKPKTVKATETPLETTRIAPETTRTVPETTKTVPKTEKLETTMKSPPLETTKIVPIPKTAEPDTPVIEVDDITDDNQGAMSTSEQKSNNIHIIVTVVCVAGLLVFVVFGVICFRRKRNQFDLSMVYESQRDVVHEKDDEVDVETKYIIAPNKKTKTFENINFSNVDGSVRIPLNATTELIDDYSGSDRSSDDVCFEDDAPIMQNMV